MVEAIQAQNIFEYMRVLTVSMSIYEKIAGGNFEPEQIAEWCVELSKMVEVFDGLKPINYLDRMIARSVVGGSKKTEYIALCREISGKSLKESRDYIEFLGLA